MYSVRVAESCGPGGSWRTELCRKGRCVLQSRWINKALAIKKAKKLAKGLKIKYEPKIHKAHDC